MIYIKKSWQEILLETEKSLREYDMFRTSEA